MSKNDSGVTSSVRISIGTLFGFITKKIIVGVFYAIVAVLVVYLCFAATMFRLMPVMGDAPVLVQDIREPGRIAPHGTEIAVSLDVAQEHNLIENLKRTFVPQDDVAIVEVLGHPGEVFSRMGDTILMEDGSKYELSEDGKKIGDRTFITEEYLVRCLGGACEEYDSIETGAFLVPFDNAYGKVL